MPKVFYVGVKGVVCAGGKCLLLKRVKPDITHWDFPGGRMEEGESPEDALERELREELPGLPAYRIRELLEANLLPNGAPDGMGLLFLHYRIETAPFTVELSAEHAEYQWIGPDDVEVLAQDPVLPLGLQAGVLRKALHS